MNRLPPASGGIDLRCARCSGILWRIKKHSLDRTLAWAVTALFFYALVFIAPLLEVTLFGRMHIGDMVTGFLALDTLGFWMLAAVVFLTTIFLPLIKIAGTALVVLFMRLPYPPRGTGSFFALLQRLDAWTMVEVYGLGLAIAYTRLQAITSVRLAEAAFGLGGLMIAITAMDAALDPEAVWEKIGRRARLDAGAARALTGCDTCRQVNPASRGACLRCGEILLRRKPQSLARTWALAISAAVLYVPSNLLPVMNVTQLGRTKSYTIFGGIRELTVYGLWPLAAIVFLASIAIPLFKLIALAAMLIQTHRRSASRLRSRTGLYRLIDFIGRWSMVDIFMVSILVAAVRFGWLATITSDWGIVCFAGVVILTLFAVKSFDPRLMWDVAEIQAGASRPGRVIHVRHNE